MAISQKLAKLTKQSCTVTTLRAVRDSSGLSSHHHKKAWVSRRTGNLHVLREIREGFVEIGSHPDSFARAWGAFDRFNRDDLHNRPVFLRHRHGFSQHRLLHDLGK